MAPDTAPGGPAFRNGLLAALSDEDVERLRPHLQRVRLVLKQVSHEPGEHMDHAPDATSACTASDEDPDQVQRDRGT